MLMPPKRYTITAALPYANGPLHIGHLAGAYLPADIYARFLRLMGKDVAFICGSDEHGAAITIRAKKEGLSPKEIIDKYHAQFDQVFKDMGISFDIYHRTSSKLHHETAQEFFKTLYNKGEFKEIESEQFYDEAAGQFLADRYIIGTCPKCGHEEAYGDQCEKCGSTLSPDELINPRSGLSGNIPIKKKTTHWFLPLDKHEKWLRTWIETGEVAGKKVHEIDTWKNHVIGQCKSWLDNGLQPRAMTRDLDWGVDVPQDIKGSKGKKLYVWLDAPIGYISATREWAEKKGKNWKDYWQHKDAGIVHFIGKDNIVFHCLIFPAILKAHGNYNLPINVPANQFMNLEGRKISTSKGWAVWVHEYLQDFPEKQDVLRYAMIKNMPEQKDSEFTWKSFQDANDNELVANLANFSNRVFVLMDKYFKGKVPKVDEDTEIIGSDGPMMASFIDSELMELFDKVYELCNCIWEFDFRGALNWLMQISTWGNQILQANEPWKNHESNPEATKVVLNLCVQILASLSVAMRPFMPFASDKLRAQLKLPAIKDHRDLVEIQNKLAGGKYLVKAGHIIGEPFHLFSRIPDELIKEQTDKLKQNELEANPTKENSSNSNHMISFEDFAKCDIRIAKIITAEKVEKADKLLKLEVKIGEEIRTIVSGIALYHHAADIVGKEVCILANLEPRKIKGIESKGMILMAENSEGKLAFVSPPEGWEDGSRVK
jgi:methionyl-tRNA synthetase